MKYALAIALTLVILIKPAFSAEIKPNDRSFATFWTQFKEAVAKGNKEAVAGMTRFPFTMGKHLSKADFIKAYGEIFGEKTRKCFRNAKPVKESKGDTYSVFCGEDIFVFEKANGEYRFTDLGVND